jgi:hypothetical protein
LLDWDDARMIKPKKYRVEIIGEFEVSDDTKIVCIDESIEPAGNLHFLKVPINMDVGSVEKELEKRYSKRKDCLEKIPTLREFLLSAGMEEIELDEY